MQWATATTQQGFGDEDKKTLTVEDLQSWMDEGYLKNCFAHTTQESFSTKVFRNLQTGESEGYGVINFCTHADAEKVFQTYNGITMPQTEQPFQLNWASSSVCDKRSDLDSEYSLFVGNLAPDVTSTLLGEFFLRKYPSVTEANVVFDENTGRSKSIGFVTFSDDNERSQARTELNGIYFHGRPMHTGFPNRRISFGSQQQSSPQGGYASSGAFAQKVQCDEHFINTTIYVGGLDPSVSLEDLRQTFSQYGETTSVRIPGGKGFGFVKFANRSNAEEALQKLHRTVIGKQTVYLSWCKNPANKQLRVNRGNQWSGTYYGSKISEGYGYAATPLPDSSMPGGAYGTYPVYGNHQQEEFLAITHHDKSVQSLISPSIPDIAAQPTPSATKDKLCENDLSSSGNLSGWMDSESTPNKTHIPSDAVFSVQEYMGQSASEGITEILRPLQKASEGEVTEAPMSLEPCHSKGLSFGSHADVESEIVLSSTKKGNISKLQCRRA
ncbi:hypothetical protein IFM89_035315 [Coptis chinensis]|uniref:RRM domain-containing protein n=1 Tax=Coptis chinensis TaxID=261450 RepID=A0A835M862_9MAGN|nr:hypothetical protein IFM89_035315 [Coptis chinensis]